MSLLEQIKKFYEVHKDDFDDEVIKPEEFLNIFLLGFVSQIQKDIVQFFNFELIDTNDNNCVIRCSLNKDNVTDCNILNEFFLKKNLNLIKTMFGLPLEVNLEDISSGIVEIKNDEK